MYFLINCEILLESSMSIYVILLYFSNFMFGHNLILLFFKCFTDYLFLIFVTLILF